MTNYVYLMAEEGFDSPYGASAPFTVRTVAFGSVPVTATLRLTQRMTPEGLPVPLMIYAYDDYYAPGLWPAGWPSGLMVHDTDVEERVSILVENLTVDGQDLHLRPGCGTTTPATIRLHGEGFIQGAPGTDIDDPGASGHFAPGEGGLLTGAVDVPAFSNCLSGGGEELSPLLTATVAGDDNAVTVHATGPGGVCGSAKPPHPGEFEATLHCPEWFLPSEPTLPPTPITRP